MKSLIGMTVAMLIMLTACSNPLFSKDREAGADQLFSKDQEAVCEKFFEVTDEFDTLTQTNDCALFYEKLAAIPEDKFVLLEKTMLDCRYGFMKVSEVQEPAKSKMRKAASVIDRLIDPPCAGTNDDARNKLIARMEVLKAHYFEKVNKVDEAEQQAQILVQKESIEEICKFYRGLDKALNKHDDDCDLCAADFVEYMDSELPGFERALDKVPTLFATEEGTKAYQECFKNIVYEDSPYFKCIRSNNINFINANMRMMVKPSKMQIDVYVENQGDKPDVSSESANKYLETDQKYEPYISEVCRFYGDILAISDKYRGDCVAMTAAHKQYLDEHLEAFEKLLEDHKDLLFTTDGIAQLSKCSYKLLSYDSSYNLCNTSNDLDIEMVKQRARIFDKYNQLFRETELDRMDDLNDHAIYMMEKTYIEVFITVTDLSELSCEQIASGLKDWHETYGKYLDRIGKRNIGKVINPGKLGIDRIRLIQKAFGSKAPVQRCMSNEDVRKVYEQTVTELNIKDEIVN